MKTYTTVQGDMWDSIAYAKLGNTSYTDALMNQNPEHIGYYVFPAGIELVLPEVDKNTAEARAPWKQVAG